VTLTLTPGLLEATFEQLRACGQGQRECVAYWCAHAATPDVLHRVVHPRHHAGLAGYTVDSAWVSEFFLDLRARSETVQVQIHTHPGRACHSSTDDRYALAPAEGFRSLVFPNFALGDTGWDGAHLVRIGAEGAWFQEDPSAVFSRG
jgi:hypothetical protein